MKLAAMMKAAIQRRFPKGLKVHVRSIDRFGCLSSLTRVLKDANLCVTRAKVCPHVSCCTVFQPCPSSQGSRHVPLLFPLVLAFPGPRHMHICAFSICQNWLSIHQHEIQRCHQHGDRSMC